MQKRVNLVDLVKRFPTSIYLQNSASIENESLLSKLYVYFMGFDFHIL